MWPFLRITFIAIFSLSAWACDKKVDDMGSAEVDFSNPKRVLSSVFFAAKHNKDAHLASLCAADGNEHVKRICGQKLQGEDWPRFVKQFSKGKLIGEARVAQGRALVNFVFGPEGKREETMELVFREGRWLLKSF